MSNDFPFVRMLEIAVAKIREQGNFHMDYYFAEDFEKEIRCAEMTLLSIHREDRGPWAFSVLRYFCNVAQNPWWKCQDIELGKNTEQQIKDLCQQIITFFGYILRMYNVQMPQEEYGILVSLYGEDFITSLGLPTANKDRGKNVSKGKRDSGDFNFIRQYNSIHYALEKLSKSGYIAQQGSLMPIAGECIQKYTITNRLTQQELSYILRRLLGEDTPCVSRWRDLFSNSGGKGATGLFKDCLKDETSPDLEKIIKELNLITTD